MANKGPESNRSTQDLRDDNIKRMLRLSGRDGEKLSPYEAQLMLNYITERGEVTADARESIKEIAKEFPLKQYEEYVNAKLKDMKEKETTVNEDITDAETIEALRKIAASGSSPATSAPTPTAKDATPAPAPAAKDATPAPTASAPDETSDVSGTLNAANAAYYAKLSPRDKKKWDTVRARIERDGKSATHVVAMGPDGPVAVTRESQEEKIRKIRAKAAKDSTPATPAKDDKIVWEQPKAEQTVAAEPAKTEAPKANTVEGDAPTIVRLINKGLGNLSEVGKDKIAIYARLPNPKVLVLADDGAVGYAYAGTLEEAKKLAAEGCAREMKTKGAIRVISVDGVAVVPGTKLDRITTRYTDTDSLDKEIFADYEKAGGAKAFAMGPTGAYGWVVRATEEEARTAALAECSKNGQGCVIIKSSPGGGKASTMPTWAPTSELAADPASAEHAGKDIEEVVANNDTFRAYIWALPATAPAEAKEFAARLSGLIGKGSRTKPNADVKKLQAEIGTIDDGAWGKNTRRAAVRELQVRLRKKSIPVAAPVAQTGSAAPVGAAKAEKPAEKAGAARTREKSDEGTSSDRYVPISEASAVEMPDVKLSKKGELSFEDLDNGSFRKFVGDKSLAELKGIYESFYQGDFKKTAKYLEEKYGIEDAGMFITYRTQLRSFELALLACIREAESGIPEYASMLFELADFNQNNKVSEDDTISRSTENLLFARFVSMSTAQVRAMLLSAGVSVEDYQRDPKKTATAFRNYYQAAGTAGVGGAAIERGQVSEFVRRENNLRTELVALYNEHKSAVEKVAAENANMREILAHLPDGVSRESFLQGVFLEYAGVVFGANTAGTAKFNIESLGVFFDSLVVGATDKHFGVGVSKSWNLNNSGSVRAETGVMNFIPFGTLQADAYKSDPEIRDFYSKKLEGQTRISPFVAASIFDVGVGTTVMWNEKNPAIEAQTTRFYDTLLAMTTDMKAGKEPDLSKLSDADKAEFTELLKTLKQLNEQMGGDAYVRIVTAASLAYKAALAEKHAGFRLAGANVGFGLGTQLVAGLVGGPIGSLAAALVGMANIERTKASYTADEKGATQQIEYDLSKAPRSLRLFNRRAIVDADGNKIHAIALSKNEVTAIDTPTDGKTKIYEVRDGYLVTGPGIEHLSIVNFDRDGRRSKIMVFGEPKSINGTLAYRPYSPAKLPKGYTTEALEGPVEVQAETDQLASVEKGIHDRLNEAMNDESVKRVSKALEGFNTKADSFDLELATLFRQGAFGDKKSFDAAWARFTKLVDTDARWSMVKAVKADIEAVAKKGDDHKRVVMSDVFSHFMRTRSDVDKIGVPTEQHEAAVAALVKSLGAEIVAKLDARLKANPNTALDSMAGIPEAKQKDARNYLRLKLPISVYDTTLGTSTKADDRQEAFARRMAEAGISRAEADRVQTAFNTLAGKATYTGRENVVVTDGFVLPISSRVNPQFRGLTPMMAPITLATVDGKTVDIPMESTVELRKAVVAMFPPDLIEQLAKALKTDAASVRKAMEDGSNGLLSFDVSYTKWGACCNGGIRISKLKLGGHRIVVSATEGFVTSENVIDRIGAMYGIGAVIDSTGAVTSRGAKHGTTPGGGTGTGDTATPPAV